MRLGSAHDICRVVCAVVISCLSVGVTSPAYSALSHDAALTWQTLHTPNFRIHFHDGLADQAQNVAAIAENVHRRLTPYFSWQPKLATDIVLMDEVDFANGFATPLPSNRIVLWLAPPEEGVGDYGPWLESLITHEYVHTLHLDKAVGSPAFFQQVFGRHPLLFPGIFQPAWLIEGLATLLETDVSRGIGRGQSSYFDMLMRVEVLKGLKPVDQINQPIASWPAGVVNYLYGVEFYKFLLRHFDEARIKALINEYSSNLIPARVNGTFSSVFGKTLDELWTLFGKELREHYAAQERRVLDSGKQAGQRISKHGYRTGKSRVLPDGALIYVGQDGRSQVGLFLKETPHSQQSERLLDLNGLANIDLSLTGQVIIAQPERIKTARIFFDLYRYDMASKEMVRLTHGKRYRFASWGPEGRRLVAVRFSGGQYAVDLLDQGGELIKNIWQGESGEIISHIDWSPVAEQAVATVWRPGRGWNIEILSLGDGQWRALTEDPSIQLQPSFSDSGEGVVFSADYDGIYNLYQINVSTRQVLQLTNVITGAFNPVYDPAGGIFYTGYHEEGYDIYHLDNGVQMAKVKVESETKRGTYLPQNTISPDNSAQWSVSHYQPQTFLQPSWWTPILALDRNTVIAGLMTSASDPLNRHSYELSFALDSESRSLLGGLAYRYDRWFPVLNLMMSRSIARETDNAGRLLKVRESDFLQAGLDWPFMFLQYQWALHSAFVMDKEHDGYIKQPQARVDDLTEGLLALGASYNSSRKYPLSISASDGRLLSFKYEDSDFVSSDYQGQALILDWREYLSLGKEHVLAVKGIFAEAGSGSRRFELGGSESTLFEPGVGMVFNQRDFPLRGYAKGLSSLRGNNLRFFGVEWRFPIKRVERGFMSPPIGFDQISAAIFYDVGRVWDSGAGKDASRSGSGIELYGDTYLLYRFPVRFRLGYARGHDEGGENQFYLRLGSSF